MTAYDCFNGDADGICSLVQLRLAQPKHSTLVTGIKRDIKLLNKIDAQPGDDITVLDVSMAKNTAALVKALDAGARVFYADHHQAGDIPQADNLEAHINTASNVCTALIINGYLKGAYQDWAIVAAFGDNITAVAEQMCTKVGYSEQQTGQLRQLGICMNYNGYGATEDDLFYHPAELYRIAVQYASPFEFIEKEAEVFNTLVTGYEQDMAKALAVEPCHVSDNAAMFILPNEKWARRVSGVVGNELANQFPDRAHAILTEREELHTGDSSEPEKTYQVSIRAPKNNPVGADDIAVKFGGGGRKGAAGIDVLPKSLLFALFEEF